MQFSGKMCFKIILKVTKNQCFTLSLEDRFFEKPQGEGVQFERELVAAMYKKVKYEQEIDDFVEINLWGITESQRYTADNIFFQTKHSDIGHVRVYSLQSLKENQWLNSEVMDVIFEYVVATQSDTVRFSHIVMK